MRSIRFQRTLEKWLWTRLRGKFRFSGKLIFRMRWKRKGEESSKLKERSRKSWNKLIRTLRKLWRSVKRWKIYNSKSKASRAWNQCKTATLPQTVPQRRPKSAKNHNAVLHNANANATVFRNPSNSHPPNWTQSTTNLFPNSNNLQTLTTCSNPQTQTNGTMAKRNFQPSNITIPYSLRIHPCKWIITRICDLNGNLILFLLMLMDKIRI